MTPAQFNELQRQADVIEQHEKWKKEQETMLKKTAIRQLRELLKDMVDEKLLATINWDYFNNLEYKQITDARADGLHQGLYTELDRITHQEYFKENYHD
jgi:hypothetical protein